MFETYIFDLYGTLVDIHTNEGNPYLWKKLSLFMTLQGAAYAPLELKKAFRAVIESERKANYADAVSKGLEVSKREIEVDFRRVITALYREKEMSVSEEGIRQWAVLFRTLSLKHLSLFPEAKELLLRLKSAGKKVYLLSNAQRLFTEPEMRALGIYDLFDDILYSSDIGFTKPSPLFYKALLEKHGIDPACAVMVGNDDQADNWGAHRMGMHSFYIQTAQSPVLTQPFPSDCTEISSLLEILE